MFAERTPCTHRRRATAGLVACAVVIGSAAPAVADPANPVPGNGFFVVGPDIAPGLYRTGGTASAWTVWVNDIPTEDSMCLWFTYSTPSPEKDQVVETNISVGPMYANINSSVKSFESRNCQPWERVT